MRRKLVDNYKRVRERIETACERAGRDAGDVRLIGVTKIVEVDIIRAAVELGMTDLGESRVQELIKRAGMVQEHLGRRRNLNAEAVPPEPRWHMIGHLQRNKVRQVMPWVTLIHSVDSLRLAEEISAEAQRTNRPASVLIEVNVAGEKSKFGIAFGAVTHFAGMAASIPGLRIEGLMAMAPRVDDPEKVRGAFVRLRELFEEIRTENICGPEFRELSMGMSDDFDVAVEEGATMVRVGRALFEGVVEEVRSKK